MDYGIRGLAALRRRFAWYARASRHATWAREISGLLAALALFVAALLGPLSSALGQAAQFCPWGQLRRGH